MKNFIAGMVTGAALTVTGIMMYLTGKAKSGMSDEFLDEQFRDLFDSDDDYDDDYEDEDNTDKKESDKFWGAM